MRLWTVHPRFLDSKGLVALWREGLLAKAVLEGKTRGYQNHPQLVRFKAQPDPVASVTEYLRVVLEESKARGYKFDASKIPSIYDVDVIEESSGQLAYEWQHLLKKLEVRDRDRYNESIKVSPLPHPLFNIVPGVIREWEKVLN